jgi:site-specific recombinase XerD
MPSFGFRKVDGRYYARISEKGRNPEEKSWPLKTTQKRTATQRLKRLEKAFDAGDFDPWEGGWIDADPVPLVDAASAFIDAKQQLRPRTLEEYAGILRRFRETLPPGIMLQDVTQEDVKAYVYASGIANATERKRFRHLRAFFNWTVRAEHLSSSPLEPLNPPKKEKKEKAFLRPQDVERLLIATRHHIDETRDALGRPPDLKWMLPLVQVAVATGLRRGELCALHWQDVDLTGRALHVRHRAGFRTKGNAERRVPLRGDALQALQELQPAPDAIGPVFIDRRGKPLRPDRVTKRFKDMARVAGLDERISFHNLRHTCGSWLAMQGVPMRVIQKILGHSSVSVTEIYSHLTPETLDAAMQETFG